MIEILLLKISDTQIVENLSYHSIVNRKHQIHIYGKDRKFCPRFSQNWMMDTEVPKPVMQGSKTSNLYI